MQSLSNKIRNNANIDINIQKVEIKRNFPEEFFEDNNFFKRQRNIKFNLNLKKIMRRKSTWKANQKQQQ